MNTPDQLSSLQSVFLVGPKSLRARALVTLLQSSVLAATLISGSASASEMRPITEYQLDMPVVAKVHHLGFDTSKHTPDQNFYELDSGTWNFSASQNPKHAYKGKGNESAFQMVVKNPETNQLLVLDVSKDVYTKHCVGPWTSVSSKTKALVTHCANPSPTMTATMTLNADGTGYDVTGFVEKTNNDVLQDGTFVSLSHMKERALEKRYIQANPLMKKASPSNF